ncbi:MAG: zinc ribbon domain-containing protein [Bacteroidales bacterium]|nr:zinc ribbon domain-containing protein [Candidatus Physcocola equi]
MSEFCSHCGAKIATDDIICPVCGMPTVHAPHSDDKKFWEEEPESTPPAFNPQQPEESQQSQGGAQQSTSNSNDIENGANTPPPYQETAEQSETTPPPYVEPAPQRYHHIEAQRKKEVIKVVIVAAVIIVLAIILIGYLAVKKRIVNNHPDTKVVSEEQQEETTPGFTIQEITGEEADSIMRMHMAEMEKMEQMMEEMMESDPFEEFERMQGMMGDEWESAPPTTQQQKPKASTPSKIQLVGKIGKENYIMVLNAKDQNNITGTAATVENGKEKAQFHLLGIGSGRDLTVSVYDSKNKIVGTLTGTYDGYMFSGVFTTDDNETQFRLMAQ